MDATEELVARVQRSTAYAPELSAVPYALAAKSTERQQLRSLRHHAEKRALADLLRREAAAAGEAKRAGDRERAAGELAMRVNVKVCADCAAFLQHAARMLGRRIVVHEPSAARAFEP